MTNAQGIDISSYQAHTPNLDACDFVIVRASVGDSPDSMFDTHASNVLKAGKVLMAYHAGANISAATQVDAFLKSISGKTHTYWLDIEHNRNNIDEPHARAFINEMHSRGYPCGVYSSEDNFPWLGQNYNWVAHYGQKPAIHYKIWQKRGSPLDLDEFNGSVSALKIFVGQHNQSGPNMVMINGGILNKKTPIRNNVGVIIGEVTKATYHVGPRVMVHGLWQYPIKEHSGWWIRPTRYTKFYTE